MIEQEILQYADTKGKIDLCREVQCQFVKQDFWDGVFQSSGKCSRMHDGAESTLARTQPERLSARQRLCRSRIVNKKRALKIIDRVFYTGLFGHLHFNNICKVFRRIYESFPTHEGHRGLRQFWQCIVGVYKFWLPKNL
jgi:hypothetical protein